MAEKELRSKLLAPVEVEHHTVDECHMVRMCLSLPVRFTAGADLSLWLTHFENYVRETGIPEAEWKKELATPTRRG